MGKKPEKKAKPKASRGVWKAYKIEGGSITRNNQFCPKCGEGFFMAKHEDRWQCGKCSYVEYFKKAEVKEEKPVKN